MSEDEDEDEDRMRSGVEGGLYRLRPKAEE